MYPKNQCHYIYIRGKNQALITNAHKIIRIFSDFIFILMKTSKFYKQIKNPIRIYNLQGANCVVKNSPKAAALRCSSKQMFLNILQFLQKNPQGQELCLKETPTQVFPANIVKFSKTAILKNICEQLLMDYIYRTPLVAASDSPVELHLGNYSGIT